MKRSAWVAGFVVTDLLVLLAVAFVLLRAPRHDVPAANLEPDPEWASHFTRKAPPQPGDWLYTYKERGQTVAEHRASATNRKTANRNKIVIQPMGGIIDRNRDTLDRLREYVEIFYDCVVEIREPIAMPEEAYDKERGQYNADRMMVILRNQLPGEALAYIGFCEEDLFSGTMNFVFGVGSLRQRVGVYSLARYGKKADRVDGEPIFLKRTFKVASHEIGHMFGMEHCVRYECTMNGSNSLGETDREPMDLCPECLEKSLWVTGFDIPSRYDRLALFCERNGFTSEAATCRERAGWARAASNAKPQ